MLLGFGYLYKFVMLHFFFFQKAESNRLKKKPIGQNFITFYRVGRTRRPTN